MLYLHNVEDVNILARLCGGCEAEAEMTRGRGQAAHSPGHPPHLLPDVTCPDTEDTEETEDTEGRKLETNRLALDHQQHG